MKARYWGLPAIGAALFIFSVIHVVRAQKTHEHPAPVAPPTLASGNHVAGTGVIEPSSENILAGSHRSGVAAKVLVTAGAEVRRGSPLFCLDDRAAVADVRLREAELAVAEAQVARLAHMPRKDELPPLVARVAQAQAKLDDADDVLRRTQRVVESSALPEEQAVRAQQQRAVAASDLRAARAELDLKRAGAWGPDRVVAASAAKQAAANLERAKTELDLLCARAPIDATVLRVDVRPGEFVNAGPASAPVTLGVTQPLHVRADFDEVEIPRFRRDARARAFIRGTNVSMPLVFVRVEPAVTPKRSLSGFSAERLDTRVLQAIYRIERAPAAAFIGQQVDILLDAPAAHDGVASKR
jgi:multidrug efflux pump subunit AcrA (membrane-fusion protein)